MTGQLLDAKQVAAMLGMGTDWVYAAVRADEIPHVHLGRYVRFRAEAIEVWLSDLEHGNMPGTSKRRGAAGTAPGMAPGGTPDA